jgi:hypothetical protein
VLCGDQNKLLNDRRAYGIAITLAYYQHVLMAVKINAEKGPIFAEFNILVIDFKIYTLANARDDLETKLILVYVILHIISSLQLLEIWLTHFRQVCFFLILN